MISCDKSFYENETINIETISNQDGIIGWENQLKSIINNPVDLLNESGISLLDYEFIDQIDSKSKLTLQKITKKRSRNDSVFREFIQKS